VYPMGRVIGSPSIPSAQNIFCRRAQGPVADRAVLVLEACTTRGLPEVVELGMTKNTNCLRPAVWWDWCELDHPFVCAVGKFSFLRLLESNDPNGRATLINHLMEPMWLNGLEPNVAGHCLNELNSVQNFVSWGKKVCLIDSDTGRVLDHCHVRATGHIDFYTEEGAGLVIGFGRMGIFVRSVDKDGKRMLPFAPHASEMALIDPDGFGHSYSDAEKGVHFRSLAMELTLIRGSRLQFRDLQTGKAFTTSIGQQFTGPEDSHYSLRLRIEEAPASAADYERIIKRLRRGLVEAALSRLYPPAGRSGD
jgi:hypothetical protein